MSASDRSQDKKYDFEGQEDGEEVMFTFRRHPVVMRKGFYMLLIPFTLSALPTLFWPDNLNNLWIALGGFVLGLILFFYHFMGWYFSIFIVTNSRIRQVGQKGFFGKSVIDLGLSKIQNISYNVPGFTAAAFGFGTIVIQTYVGDLVLDRIEHPGKIYEKLQRVVKSAPEFDQQQMRQDEES